MAREPFRFRGSGYEADVAPDVATVRVRVGGRMVAELRVTSGCDADGRVDDPALVGDPLVVSGARESQVTWRARSGLWDEITYRFAFAEDAVRFRYSVRGRGAIDVARYFAHGSEASPPSFASLWNPEPNSLQRQRLAPGERALAGVTSDKRYHEGNWFFTPGPLCFVLDSGSGPGLAAGIAAPVEAMHFTELEVPSGGFGLALKYDGHALVDGSWDSPEVVFVPAGGEYAAVEAFCSWLRRHGLAPVTATEAVPSWWREPIFCGWGEQCALGDVPTEAAGAPTLAAPVQCTQANYEHFLASLERSGIEPGTVVIDDKWQRTYGENTPDVRKWPELAGFIAAQHARGRRILLWLKAWDPEGLPPDECITDDAGRPVAADPTNAAYASRVRETARALLGELGADGFKLDFTHAIPTGRGARCRGAGGAWGIALMHRLVRLYRTAMREARADAMLMTHTAHPAFAGLVDVLRLNDVPHCPGWPKSYVAAMRHRARVARAAGPSWLLDTDNWPSPDRDSFLEYVREQPSIGIPSLYYSSRIRWRTKGEDWVDEPLRADDYAAIRGTWSRYRAGLPRLGQAEGS